MPTLPTRSIPIVTTANHHLSSLPPVPSLQQNPLPPASCAYRATPRSAVISLVCGILAFFTLFIFIGAIFALIAIVAGHVAINHIRHSSERLEGEGLAMSGVVMGYITLIATSLLMMLLVFAYQPSTHYLAQYRQQQSQQHASRLYFSAEAYAQDHREVYPKQWSDLEGHYINTFDLQDCLRSVHSFKKNSHPAFKLVPHQRPVLPAVSSQVIVIQEIAPPHIDAISVVYADGTTELIANPNR